MDLAVTVNPDGDTSLGHALSQLVTPETYACLLDRMM
jgi:hypothetical protein